MKHTAQSGLTIVEAVVSLVIVATAVIPSLAALGSAAQNVHETTNRRIMRYLAEMVIADIELGRIMPDEEEERYEEGMSQSFEGFGSADDPDEYADYEFMVEVHREISITGGMVEDSMYGEEEGNVQGRAVTNDAFDDPTGEGEGEMEEDQGQLKRVVVIAIRRVGDDWSDDRTLRVMTILPVPGEEEQAAAGAGGAPGGVPGGNQNPAESGATRGRGQGATDR